MNTELLKKIAPVLVALGLILPATSYFLFFNGKGKETVDQVYDPGKGGIENFPAENAKLTINEKEVPLRNLREVVTSTTSDVRDLTKSISLLGEAHDIIAAPELLRLMDHSDVVVRGKAAIAMEKIIGASYGYNPTASPEDRKKVKAFMEKSYQAILAKQKRGDTKAQKN